MSGLWSTKCPVEWRINAADYIILTRLPLAQHHKFSIFPTFENNFAYPVSDFNKSLYYNRIHRPVEKKGGGGYHRKWKGKYAIHNFFIFRANL